MNKTQLLSETDNLIYCLGKNTIYIERGISYLIQQLVTTASVLPEMKMEISPNFHQKSPKM